MDGVVEFENPAWRSCSGFILILVKMHMWVCFAFLFFLVGLFEVRKATLNVGHTFWWHPT